MARRTLRWIAGLRLVTAIVAAVLLAGLVDWTVRAQEPLLRWSLSLLVLAGIVAVAFRWAWPAFRANWSRIATARRIEQRFPELKHRLTSAVAFAAGDQNDQLAGSLELRRAAIAEAEALAVHADFTEVLDQRPLRRAALVATGAICVLAVVAAALPISSAIAARRLFMPWAAVNWPLRHSLAFEHETTQLAAGDDFEARVLDRNGRLPDNVQLQVRFEGGNRRFETFDMKPLGERMVYRLDNVSQPFSYRAVGGDDWTMPWTSVEVVEPPRLTQFVLRISPPKYSGWPEETSEGLARVVAGSRLTVQGRLDKHAKDVRLVSRDSSQTIDARMADDGMSFTIPSSADQPWIAEKSAVYSFEMVDESGIAGNSESKIELQVLADSAPAIAWDTPVDQTFVTTRAIVPIKAIVKDDLAIDTVILKFLRPDATAAGEQEVELYRAAQSPMQLAASRQVVGRDGESLSIDHEWDLLSLGLEPGQVLAVRIEASDFKPQTATTTVRRISVIGDAELQNRLLQQQTSVFTQLAEALRLQRDAHLQVSALRIALDETKELQTRDIDQLQAAELVQRQVMQLLGDSKEGATARLTILLEELANNRVEGKGTARRLTELRESVRTINGQLLPKISQHLMSALKSARGADLSVDGGADDATLASVMSPLKPAEESQQQAIDQLEALLGQLSQWDNYSRLSREIGQIRQSQEKLQKETEVLRWKVAASAGEQPLAEHRAGARQVAVRQQDLARRFDKLQVRMDELFARLQASDPQAAGALGDARQLAQRLAIGGRMRQVGRELSELKLGEAQQSQQSVLDSLAELLDALSSRRDKDLARTVESLRAAQGELDELRDRQRQLMSQAEQAAEASQSEEEQRRQLMRLVREQEEVAQKTEELRRKLERLQAKRSAESAAESTKRMGSAGEAAQAGDAGQTQEQTREASQLLEETRRRLAAEIEQAKADLLREQLAQVEQLIEALVLRQSNLVSEIHRLEKARDASGHLPAAQEQTLTGIASEQGLLAEETEQLRLKLADTPAFALAMEGAVREMRRAESQLQRGETGAACRRAAEGARDRLKQVLAALKQDTGTEPAADDDAGEEGGDQQSSEGESRVRSVAELQLLADLQHEINRRTAQIEESRNLTGELTAAEQEELASLAAEQGKLAEMVLELAGRSNAEGTENLEIPPRDDAKADTDGSDAQPKPSTLDEQLLRDLEGQ